MIPLRVTVENFLSYGTPAVEFHFDGEPLWILCGLNGTGKSAVFDAITYALFGYYRGSDRRANRAEELIHHGASWFRVEFEFEFNGVDYRISRKKTAKGPPKVGAARRLDRDADEAGWEPLGDINGVRELDTWVAEKLGLSFHTFVCSVLLRQGKAEEIIDADNATRLKVLHGVIDFERYVELHKRVADDTTELTRAVKSLQARLGAMPEISDAELSGAKAEWDPADCHLGTAREATRAAHDMLGHARTWEILHGQQTLIHAELAAASERAKHAAEIERLAGRLRELRHVVPILSALIQAQGAIRRSAERFENLSVQLADVSARKEGLAASVDQERQKAEQHREAVADLDRRIPEMDAQVQGIISQMHLAEDAAQLRRELQSLDVLLQEFPVDLDDRLADGETRLVHARAARDALPHLEGMSEARRKYLASVETAANASLAEAAESAEAERLSGDVRAAESGRAAADQVQRDAERQKAEATARWKDAKDRLQKFRTVAGGAVCSECRRPIDADHAAEEIEKLEVEIRACEQRMEGCVTAVQVATEQWVIRDKALTILQQQLRTVERQREDATRSLQQAALGQQDAVRAFQRVSNKVTDPYRSQLADIQVPGFPTASDLAEITQLSESVDTLDKRVRGLRQSKQDCDLQRAERKNKHDALARLGAQPQPDALAGERHRLESELTELQNTRLAEDAARASAEMEERRLSGELKKVDAEGTRLTGNLAAAAADRAAAELRATDERKRLPAEWIPCADTFTDEQLATWCHELDSLDRTGVEQQSTALANDRAVQANREQQLRDLEEQIAKLPEDSRRPAASVELDVRTAEEAESDAATSRTHAASRLEDLNRRAGERKHLVEELAETGRKRDLHDRLAGLLGKSGLQRDLVRDAEREIVDLANDTLFRVSNGDLRLERPAAAGEQDDGEAVFDLSIRQAGIPNLIGLAFLSGSQRFRVAVALALAVGQFASRQARPLEAVIIDEGFGCLDRIGRIAMIEELQRLQRPGDLPNLLKRIILVSHHEDFSDSFPVGYQLVNVGGTTEAKLFRK